MQFTLVLVPTLHVGPIIIEDPFSSGGMPIVMRWGDYALIRVGIRPRCISNIPDNESFHLCFKEIGFSPLRILLDDLTAHPLNQLATGTTDVSSSILSKCFRFGSLKIVKLFS